MPIHSTPDQAERVLKKLKPTKVFSLSDSDFEAFIEFVQSNDKGDLKSLWKSLTQRKTPANRSKNAQDPLVLESTNVLKEFAATRGLLAAEGASAFVAFCNEEIQLPKPTKTALKGIPAAAKWVAGKSSSAALSRLTNRFVEKFQEETDYSYERRV